ncbi:IPT/TIG domain-containing protein [Labilibaculum antarcticum]|uniref:Uncharacterized protein n=1 Tax=Labilibaculum antarcticum TaxID=1717717 RepID=A0A1Y1CII4_9BACT|nr:IPT/TIG domain-containing protein [Labilibaculum antarcticum]BAX79832.1 hypothetical protein ALGA_1453 [Labilibaculum antarcticum]
MKKYILISLSILISLFACDKDEADRPYARIRTLGVQNINANGVAISAEIYDASKLNIEDHGFVYNIKSSSLPENSDENTHFESYFEKESLGSKNGDGIFETTLTRNLIKDTTYTAKAYVFSNGITTYGESIEFESMGGSHPVIKSFYPDTVGYGETVTITGDNFSFQSHFNNVNFNEVKATIISNNDSILKVIFPIGLSKRRCPINITVGDKTTYSSDSITIAAPLIDSISRIEILSGDFISVHGKFFTGITEVLVGNRVAQEFSWRSNSVDSIISFRIPGYIPAGKIPISFKFLNDSITYPNTFISILPTIDSFTPKKLWLDSIVTVRGTHLKKINYLGLISGNHPITLTDTLATLKINEVPTSRKVRGYYNGNQIESADSIIWKQPSGTSFSVDNAKNNEMVYLYGDHFVYGLDVYFGETKATTYYISKNKLQVYIPEIPSGTYNPSFKYKYSSKVIDPTIKSEASISIPQIKILDVQPRIIKRGDAITVTVENANLNGIVSLSVGNSGCSITKGSSNVITGRISYERKIKPNPLVSVSIGGQKVQFDQPLQLIEPWDIIPSSDLTLDNGLHASHPNGEIIITKGDNTSQKYIQQHSGNNNWKVIAPITIDSWTYNMLQYNNTLYFPTYNSNHGYHLKSFSLSTKTESVTDTISIGVPEFSFIISNKLYVGNTKKMECYNLNTKLWESKTKLPTTQYNVKSPIVFTIGSKAYLAFHTYMQGNSSYTEHNEFWVYDSLNNSWSQLAEIPAKIYEESTVSYYNDKFYLFARGYQDDRTFWEYSPNENIWRKLFPPTGGHSNFISFVENNELYFGARTYFGDDKYILDLNKIHYSDIENY